MFLVFRSVSLGMLGFLLAAGGLPDSVPSTFRRTIEPTLPLLIDVRLAGVERSAGRVRGRLEIDLRAHGNLDHVELSMELPDALRVVGDEALPTGFRMPDGERRLIVLPLEGPGDRDLPIRLSGALRLEDGRTFRLGQGVTLEAPRPGAHGRSRLGAWEVMAVPLGDSGR